jgi:hypothetical protein
MMETQTTTDGKTTSPEKTYVREDFKIGVVFSYRPAPGITPMIEGRKFKIIDLTGISSPDYFVATVMLVGMHTQEVYEIGHTFHGATFSVSDVYWSDREGEVLLVPDNARWVPVNEDFEVGQIIFYKKSHLEILFSPASPTIDLFAARGGRITELQRDDEGKIRSVRYLCLYVHPHEQGFYGVILGDGPECFEIREREGKLLLVPNHGRWINNE